MDQFQKECPEEKLYPGSLLASLLFPHIRLARFVQSFSEIAEETLVGDEKLLQFTGDSGEWVYGDRGYMTVYDLGLWFYELVVTLNNGCPYLVHSMFSNSNPHIGESLPVNAVVREWAKVADFFVKEKKSKPPVLTFDSDNEGRRYLNENGRP